MLILVNTYFQEEVWSRESNFIFSNMAIQLCQHFPFWFETSSIIIYLRTYVFGAIPNLYKLFHWPIYLCPGTMHSLL